MCVKKHAWPCFGQCPSNKDIPGRNQIFPCATTHVGPISIENWVQPQKRNIWCISIATHTVLVGVGSVSQCARFSHGIETRSHGRWKMHIFHNVEQCPNDFQCVWTNFWETLWSHTVGKKSIGATKNPTRLLPNQWGPVNLWNLKNFFSCFGCFH